VTNTTNGRPALVETKLPVSCVPAHCFYPRGSLCLGVSVAK
jgi:hypothetical protein